MSPTNSKIMKSVMKARALGKQQFVYFDNMNTTFPDCDVIDTIKRVLESRIGNPSSHIHSAGINAGRIIDEAREKAAAFINSSPGSILFTSGATESNNLALTGFLRANPDYQLAVSAIEHYSIINQIRFLKETGISAHVAGVDKNGVVGLDQLEGLVGQKPTLVSIALANPEIGTIQDIKTISKICHKHGAVLHCDATAAAGLIAVDVADMGIDLLTLSGHNIYGPTGVGALYVDSQHRIEPLFAGGNQEMGFRPGTENVPGIAGFGEACRLAKDHLDSWSEKLTDLGRKLWQALGESVPFVHFTGHPERRLPGHVSFWVEHVEGESLLLLLNMNGIMASSGSACSSNLKGKDESDLRASHVLTAVGVPTDICSGSITFSLGKYNTEDEVDHVISVMPGIVERLLAMSPSYEDYKKSEE
jgi:cysteine desulfurase